MTIRNLNSLKNINGELIKPKDSEYIRVFNPSVGKVYAKCPNSGIKDLNLAVTSANKAFTSWSKKTNEERSDILFSIADELERNKEKFAVAETTDNGKPLNDFFGKPAKSEIRKIANLPFQKFKKPM